MANGREQLTSFRVVDVYLTDQVPQLFNRVSLGSREDENEAGRGGRGAGRGGAVAAAEHEEEEDEKEEEEEQGLEDSMLLQMSMLGLPTSFSSSLHRSRKSRSHGQLTNEGGGGGGEKEGARIGGEEAEVDQEEAFDGSMHLLMSNLGLPTSFSSSSYKSHSHRSRHHRKRCSDNQVSCSLISDVISTPSLPMSTENIIEDDSVRASNDQAHQCADVNPLASSPASTKDGFDDLQAAAASSSGAILAASAPVKLLKLAGNVISALGAFIFNRGSTDCERGTMSDTRGVDSIEVLAESTDNVLEDEAACIGKDDFRIFEEGSSFVDSEKLPINVLNLPAADSVVITDSASLDGSLIRPRDMLVEAAEQDVCAEGSEIPDVGGSHWLPCWDSYYGRYYFYNAETQESTWEPPKGFEPCVSTFILQASKDDTATDGASTEFVAESRQVFVDDLRRAVDLQQGTTCAQVVSRFSKDIWTAETVVKGGNSLTASDNATPLVPDASISGAVLHHEEIASFNGSRPDILEGVMADSARSPQTAEGINEVQRGEMESSMKDLSGRDPNSGFTWSASWDEYYGRYYFYNTQTLESTWEPPKGFEAYANPESNRLFEGNVFVPAQSKVESTLEDRSKSVSLLQAVGMVSSSRDPTYQEVCSANQGESALNLEVRREVFDGKTEGQDVSNQTTEAIDTHVKAAVLQRRAKQAAHHLLLLADKDSDTGVTSTNVSKYRFQRFHLFSKILSGMKLDDEGWYSVTPEAIAKHQAGRCKGDVIVDAFAGVGGNAIQFALAGYYVIAIDNNAKRLAYAHHNANIYGVAECIDFVLGDFFKISSSMRADVIFLSPPWGGPGYQNAAVYNILTMLQPKDAVTLLNAARSVASNIILFLPRNVEMKQLSDLQKMLPFLHTCEVERNFLNGKLKAVTAYFGEFASLEYSSGQ